MDDDDGRQGAASLPAGHRKHKFIGIFPTDRQASDSQRSRLADHAADVL
ncbi:MAG TPA: hypothetical protein VMB75_07210 [Rhodocyclaceae bacterium]|nr:hypothetical protein [Rhodocyclaceae bacterium]